MLRKTKKFNLLSMVMLRKTKKFNMLFVIVLVFGVAGCGCLSFPTAGDYEDRPAQCLELARCMYYNQKNPDKSVCVKLAESCRRVDVYDYCEIKAKAHPDDIKYFQNCWDKIE